MPEGKQTALSYRDALIVITLALMAVGLVTIASARSSLDQSLLNSFSLRTPLARQALFAGMSIVVLALSGWLALRVLASPRMTGLMAAGVLTLALLGLLAVLVPGIGDERRGSQRWIEFGGGLGFHLQPSEIAKVALVLFLAWLLTARRARLGSFLHGFLPAAGVIAVLVALVGYQDFGTSALLALVGGLMLLVGGCRLLHLTVLGVIGLVGMGGLLWAEPYRIDRLRAFLDPLADPLAAGYQPTQSLTAISSGGWFGTGLGAGIQKYGYLPEGHTDFIFAVICEETGFLGAVVVIGLYAAFVFVGLQVMRRAATGFERLVAFGLTAIIGWQAAMNIAVVTVLAPTTGISLPFVSAGGSGLLTFCAAVGILAAIAQRGVAVDDAPLPAFAEPPPLRMGLE